MAKMAKTKKNQAAATRRRNVQDATLKNTRRLVEKVNRQTLELLNLRKIVAHLVLQAGDTARALQQLESLAEATTEDVTNLEDRVSQLEQAEAKAGDNDGELATDNLEPHE